MAKIVIKKLKGRVNAWYPTYNRTITWQPGESLGDYKSNGHKVKTLKSGIRKYSKTFEWSGETQPNSTKGLEFEKKVLRLMGCEVE